MIFIKLVKEIVVEPGCQHVTVAFAQWKIRCNVGFDQLIPPIGLVAPVSRYGSIRPVKLRPYNSNCS